MKVVKLRPVLLPESFLYYLYYQVYKDLKHFTLNLLKGSHDLHILLTVISTVQTSVRATCLCKSLLPVPPPRTCDARLA